VPGTRLVAETLRLKNLSGIIAGIMLKLRFAPTRIVIVRLFCALFASTALGLITGCGNHGESSVSAPPASNILRLAMTTDPTTLDPALVQDGVTIDLLQQIYEGLVEWTPQNKLAPALATSWTKSKDGLTYTFNIRPGVKFHSGAPVTADDVVFSLSRCLNPALKSPVGLTYMSDIVGAADYASGKAPSVTGLKALGQLTVQIKISHPKAYWLNILTYPTAYIVNPATVAKDATGAITAANTDGTGPFVLSSYQMGVAVDLKSNPNYWAGAPKIAGQHRLILTDANTRHSEYLAGQIDIVDESQGQLDADKSNPALASQVHIWPRAATWYVSFGEIAEPIFKDVRVRQAFAYATDKSKIAQVVFDGERDVAQDILPEGLPGWTAQFQGIPFDPAKARQLLAAAGYPNGAGFPVLHMSYRESLPDVAKTVDLLRGMYQQNLGVTIQAQQTEWTTLLSQEDNKALPIYHMRWSADYLDPQDYYSLLYHSKSPENNTGYSNTTYDALCDAADVEQDPVKRAALYRKAARIVANEVPMIPLYYQKDPELVRPYVKGLDDSLMGHLPYKHVYFQN
jgi:oligopeptide transport system substrate-binding protein